MMQNTTKIIAVAGVIGLLGLVLPVLAPLALIVAFSCIVWVCVHQFILWDTRAYNPDYSVDETAAPRNHQQTE